jgi:hypothetical protein
MIIVIIGIKIEVIWWSKIDVINMKSNTIKNDIEKVLKINFWSRHALLYTKDNHGGLDDICSFECSNMRLSLLGPDLQICFKGHMRYNAVPLTCGSINMDFVDRIVLDFNTCGVIGAI